MALNQKPIVFSILVLTMLSVATSSCKSAKRKFLYGTFKLRQRPDEIMLKPDLISFVESNPRASFIVRVPVVSENVTKEEPFEDKSRYFALEKILIESGFVVNDRTLYEKRVTQNIDYLNTTDFVLELVHFKLVNYTTNKVIPEGAKDYKDIELPRYFMFIGSQAEFKIIRVETNEVVAVCTLNYTPCTDGCRMKYTTDGYIQQLDGDLKTRRKNGYQSVDIDRSSIMFSELAARLVREIRRQSEK